jgi:hypothetical protein
MQTGKPKKLTAASLDEFPLIIAATPATKQERKVALAIILILAFVFIAIAPFASIQLPRVDAFVPALQTVLCVTDLITAALLFSLYSIQPLPGLLALASGYIFSGLFAFLQTLAFPGAYSPSGLIGDQLSSAPFFFGISPFPSPSACMRCRMIAREPMIRLADSFGVRYHETRFLRIKGALRCKANNFFDYDFN